jgi:hypothetical protein
MTVKSPYDDLIAGEGEGDGPILRGVKSIGRAISEDHGVRAGVVQVIYSLAGLAIRALSPQAQSLTRYHSEEP